MDWIILISLLIVVGEAMVDSNFYDSSTCGKSLKPMSRFIHGGEEVVSEEFPWSVRITYAIKGKPDLVKWCSGTLISKKHVLTAAHCFPSLKKGNTPFLSSYEIFAEEMCANGCADRQIYMRGVESVSLHEKFWVHGNSTNDVALIELDTSMPDDVNHACLPTDDFKIDEKNDEIIVTGVGGQLNGKYNTKLKKVVLGKRSSENLVDEFCVYGEGRKATCPGDDGAGAMSIINDRYVLVGVQTKATCRALEDRSINYFTDVVQWLPRIQNAMRHEKLYDRETCGTSSQLASRFVRGGSPVKAMETPWSVRVDWTCSGTLISRKHVLTAAHCWSDFKTDDLLKTALARASVEFVGVCGTNECENMPVRNISKILLHEKYFTTGNWSDDIAVLELSSPVPAYVHHVCLPTSDFPIDEANDDIILSAVGMRASDDLKMILEKVVLGKRMGEERKVQTLHNQPGTFGVDSTDAKAVCPGDSGGGAVSVINNRNVVIGIASMTSCYIDVVEQRNSSSYFVEVPNWLSQIEKAMGVQLN